MCPHGLVTVNVDDGDDLCIIDPRRSGNIVKFINHSCDPNFVLETIAVRDRYIVKVRAVVLIEVGREATVCFQKSKRATRSSIACNCESARCSGFLWG